MALRITITSTDSFISNYSGLRDVKNLYIRISRYSGEGNICRFSLAFFAFNEVTAEPELFPVKLPDRVFEFEVTEGEKGPQAVNVTRL